MYYFKRHWEETTGDTHTDAWGSCNFYFETDANGYVPRQVEVFESGRVLKYDNVHMQDEYGTLADVALDLTEFAPFAVEKSVFDVAWRQSG